MSFNELLIEFVRVFLIVSKQKDKNCVLKREKNVLEEIRMELKHLGL